MTHHELIARFFQNDHLDIRPLSGGDINAVYAIRQGASHIVAKINRAADFPEMLVKEANGLEALNHQEILSVPIVRAAGTEGDLQYLFMEYVESAAEATPAFWSRFGAGLAEQHKRAQSGFGFDEDNFIGSLVQSNGNHESWAEFLINERFIPQIRLAQDNELLSRDEVNRFEGFYNHIESIWPKEPPALLHGDLWSGNFIVGLDDQPYLIDPAVYRGHRETDLGMMHLFGGFDRRLFEVYDSVYPLENGWRERIPFNQLYPLLVHLNLFGRTYFQQINRIIRPFS